MSLSQQVLEQFFARTRKPLSAADRWEVEQFHSMTPAERLARACELSDLMHEMAGNPPPDTTPLIIENPLL